MIRPGAALDHVRQHRLGHEERAREVDRDHLVPVLVGHLQHGLVDRDPGVVDEHVEAAVALDHLVDRAAAVLGRADVALVDAALDAVVLELGQELAGVLGVAAVAGGDDRALLGEAPGDRGADPARAAGHEHDPPVHPRSASVRRDVVLGVGAVGAGAGGARCRCSCSVSSRCCARSAFRALAQATRPSRARSPCAPRSRRSGRCGRRAGRCG